MGKVHLQPDMAEPAPQLRINRITVPISNLGHGRRAAIWVQGCTIGCPGCIARHTWNRKGGEVIGIDQLAELLELLEARDEVLDGLTISGGEPMEQAEAVFAFVKLLRSRNWLGETRDVLVYSGWEPDRLEQTFAGRLDTFDVIVAGPYRKGLEGDGLMGSSNQRVLVQTPLGRSRYGGSPQPRRPMEGSSDGEVILLNGISRPEEVERFATLLGQYGMGLR